MSEKTLGFKGLSSLWPCDLRNRRASTTRGGWPLCCFQRAPRWSGLIYCTRNLRRWVVSRVRHNSREWNVGREQAPRSSGRTCKNMPAPARSLFSACWASTDRRSCATCVDLSGIETRHIAHEQRRVHLISQRKSGSHSHLRICAIKSKPRRVCNKSAA